MKRVMGSIITLAFVLTIASQADCGGFFLKNPPSTTESSQVVSGDSFSKNPPSKTELSPVVSRVLDKEKDPLCFKSDIERGMYASFGQSAEMVINSIDVVQTGQYNFKGEYWPVKVHVTATCTLQYRDDFAQNSPAYADWPGKVIENEIDTMLTIAVIKDDFGKIVARNL